MKSMQMRRSARGTGRLTAVVLAGLTLAQAGGCVAVSARHTSVGTRAAVALNGRVYLVDTRTGNAEYIDVSQARPFDAECEQSETRSGSR
ncbi:MAG: hypothetical protein IPM64_02680 [Phycisphaerales bacterium]|nr:hypothetical protein [Phycisphaerales bacterium]